MPNGSATILRLLLAAVLAAAAFACSSDKAQPVAPQDFYARHNPAVTPISPLDRPGVIPLPDAHAPASPPVAGESVPEPAESDLRPLPAVPPPTTGPSLSFVSPATQSATQPSLAADQYMTLGSVVVVVNGTPIFANKVLRADIDILRGYARQMDIIRFEDAARTQLEEHRRAANRRRIGSRRRRTHPRSQGHPARPRLYRTVEPQPDRRSRRLRAGRPSSRHESGEDFEDQEQDTYRRYLQELYYFRKISPQIDITAEDERRYYLAHLDEFTTPTQATIILIEANPAKLNGDPAAAKARLLQIRQRALAGEDFADYARRQNDLPGSVGDQGNGGQMTIKPNTLVLSNVEAQVWKTAPGQISDVIDDHDDFFIFKVISRDAGGTKAFADRTVQEAITKHLTDIQRSQRREAELMKLRAEAIVSPENLEPVVEMAKQNYPAWSRQ